MFPNQLVNNHPGYKKLVVLGVEWCLRLQRYNHQVDEIEKAFKLKQRSKWLLYQGKRVITHSKAISTVFCLWPHITHSVCSIASVIYSTDFECEQLM